MATESTESPSGRVTRELADPATGSRPETAPEPSGAGLPLSAHTQAFTAPAASPSSLYANRVQQARIKVNSARLGVTPPRQTGPWTPQAVAGVVEEKPNEIPIGVASVPAWPRAVNETMEYEALAAMVRETGPVTPEGKLPRVMLKQTLPVELLDGKTRPVTPPPDMMMRMPARAIEPQPASQRATQIDSPEVLEAIAALAPTAPLDDHRFEQAVALMLLVSALYLVYLITG